MSLRVVCVIPARGGSKGLPGKNVAMVAGKPLIAYSIEAALACPGIHRTVVSTDDGVIASVAREFGAEVPFERPKAIATDTATTEDVLRHAIEWLDVHGDRADVVVFLQPTDLFRKQAWVNTAVDVLKTRPEIDSAIVGYVTYKNYWKKDGDLYSVLSHRGYGPRQGKSTIIREDTGLACATRADFVRTGRRIGDRVHIIENTDFAAGIDIHDEFDRALAEFVIQNGWRRPND